MFGIFGELKSAKNKLEVDQAEKMKRSQMNIDKLARLVKMHETLEKVIEKLSEAQKNQLVKAKLGNKEELEKELATFNETGESLEAYQKRLEKLFLEINDVMANLPASEGELKEQWEKIAKEIFEKYHLQN